MLGRACPGQIGLQLVGHRAGNGLGRHMLLCSWIFEICPYAFRAQEDFLANEQALVSMGMPVLNTIITWWCMPYYFVPFFWQTIFYCMVWNIGTNSIFDELWYRKWNWISSLQVFTARHLLGRYSVGTTYVQPKCMIVQSGDIAFSDFRFQIFCFTFLI